MGALTVHATIQNYFLLKDTVPAPSLPSSGLDSSTKSNGDTPPTTPKELSAANVTLTARQILATPLVAEVTLAYFLVKFVRYSFYMWLPIYLEGSLGYDRVVAGYLSTSFEVGGVAASAGMSFVTRRFFAGSDLNSCRASLALCSLSLVLFLLTSDWGMLTNSILLALAGAGVSVTGDRQQTGRRRHVHCTPRGCGHAIIISG